MNIRKLLFVAISAIALIACQKEVDHYMTLSTKQLSFEPEGSTVSFDLKTNVYVRVNNDCTFAEIIDESKSGDVTTYTLRVSENVSRDARSSQIRFIGDYVTPLKLNISQSGVVPVGVDPESVTVTAKETSATFKVLGNKPWTASSDNAEFKLNFTSGTGETQIVVTFPENTTEEDRICNITVKINGKEYVFRITQKGLPKKEYKDLGAAATSNCYLVSEPGYYKFKATVRGNGKVPDSQSLSATIAPASVGVLWCTYNTATAPASNNVLTQNVELVDGYVRFNSELAGFVEGNSVIAAYDASGKIIWTWHIWLTEPSNDIACGTDKWMDRNLGALSPSTYQTTDPLACGMHFQWGRKDPFPGSVDLSNENNPFTTTIAWPDPILVDETHQGIDFSIENPTEVIYVKDASHNSKDWIWGVQYSDLWGGGAEATKTAFGIAKTDKTMFDPCPVGYCVPTSAQHKALETTFGLSKTTIDNAHFGNGVQGFWLVYAGGLLYNSGTLGGNVGEYSWYATSCTYGIDMLCTRSHMTACNFGAANSGRTCGYSVRCVKE